MKIYGNVWKRKANLWKIYRKSMKIYGNLWKSLEMYKDVRKIYGTVLKIYGTVWKCMLSECGRCDVPTGKLSV